MTVPPASSGPAAGPPNQPLERQEKQPASEEVTEVAPGIFRMQLPINMPGLGHVNCYALEDERGFAVVDPGMPDPDTFTSLTSRLAQLGAKPENVHTVLVTHSHPDHFGGAGRLRVTVDAEVVAHREFRTIFDPWDQDTMELFDARVPVVEPDGFDPARFGEYLFGDDDLPELPARHTPWGGVIPFPPKEEILRMRAWDDLTKRGFISPQPTRRLDDTEVVRLARREWIVVHTPGHTNDHMCLFDPTDGVLLSGDHVLPTITPHISGLGANGDNLADFFAGLERVAGLDGVATVLPAHGHPFADLAARTKAIRHHHEERLDLLKQIVDSRDECDVIDASHELFQERSWGSMAESETFAHLEHLVNIGDATRRSHDGRLWYRLAA
jgi:glyoxylase-like metal-dependent hydrolase (beta-lactamase superfamily II)